MLSLTGLPFGRQGPQKPSSPLTSIQSRGKFTALMDSHKLSGLLETPKLKALLKGANFVGLHTTNDVNVRGIQESGVDLNLSGDNLDKYYSAGPGLYSTKEPSLAIWYGLHAANRNPDSKAQMLAVFRLPSSEQVNRRQLLKFYPKNADQVHEIVRGAKYSDEYIETVITPAGLNSPHIEYIAVPLPKFESMQQEAIEEQLTDFVKKASV
jgi:hypothetical protein